MSLQLSEIIMITNYDLTIIIRSSDERTTDFCKFLIKQQIPYNNIFLIKKSPFSAAIKEGFELGIKNERKWTLCIDADVLVTQNGITQLVENAEKSTENIFEVQGLVLDKFFPIKRPAGNHLYRTSLMEKALFHIPEEGTSLRPESDMLNRMAENGHPWKQTGILIGTHDFEQNYNDIYRKCFLQAHKHKHLLREAESYWSSIKKSDMDFQVALWGALSGKIYNGTVLIDKNFLATEAKDALAIMGVKEKKPIATSKFSSSLVTKILKNYDPNSKIHSDFQQRMFPPTSWITTHHSAPGKSPEHSRSIKRKYITYLGKALENFGKKIQLNTDRR